LISPQSDYRIVMIILKISYTINRYRESRAPAAVLLEQIRLIPGDSRLEIVPAFVVRERCEAVGNDGPEFVDRSGCGFSQEGFEL
jgi:hypothetical protein